MVFHLFFCLFGLNIFVVETLMILEVIIHTFIVRLSTKVGGIVNNINNHFILKFHLKCLKLTNLFYHWGPLA